MAPLAALSALLLPVAGAHAAAPPDTQPPPARWADLAVGGPGPTTTVTLRGDNQPAPGTEPPKGATPAGRTGETGDAAPEAPPEGITVPTIVPLDPEADAEPGAEPPVALPPPVDLAKVRRLVAKQLGEARTRLAEVEAALLDADTRVVDAERSRLRDESRMAVARVEEVRAVRRLQVAQDDMEERATAAFIRGSFGALASVLEARDPNEFLRRTEFMGSALQGDHEAIDEYNTAKGLVADRLTRLSDQIRTAITARDEARLEADGLRPEVDLARRRVLLHEAGSSISVAGFVFPVGNPHSFVDSFLAPRMTGTSFEHRHQGTDIMAPSGTPLFACERGVVVRIGSDRLGGTKLWLVGESGTRYYYAHLSAYAVGLVEGMAVPAGQVIAYVGATGNAAGGPAHLHFEVHPPASEAVDPFPLLTVTDTND